MRKHFDARDELKSRYVTMFSLLIDEAMAGKPVPFMFCQDADGGDIILELYEEDGELHWRRYASPGRPPDQDSTA